MLRSNICCCYYPTTVIFIDDNESFLNNILLDLDENMISRSFTNPQKAIEYLQQYPLFTFSKRYLRSLKNSKNPDEFDYSNVEHGYIDIDIFNIHKEIYNPNRFDSVVVVVVVDYAMPEMKGLDVCRALKKWPFKFVLLTGHATLEKAVEAFNDGLIHKFIKKDAYDFNNKLQNIICDLQKQQFTECSDVIIKNLKADQGCCLNDMVLMEFLEDFFEKRNIVEYYLVNESGCFLMLDSKGNLSWIVVKNEDEMKEYTDMAIDNYGKETVIQALQSREKVLFLFTEEDHVNISVNDWERYLYPATKFVGEEGVYYFSHVKEECNHNIFADKIISYEEFLSKK